MPYCEWVDCSAWAWGGVLNKIKYIDASETFALLDCYIRLSLCGVLNIKDCPRSGGTPTNAITKELAELNDLAERGR